jgi:flagellar protein FlaI
MVPTNIRFKDTTSLEYFLRSMSERIGKPVSDSKPIVDAALPDGSRINIIYSDDVSKLGPSFTIRKFGEKPPTMPQLVKWGTFSAEMAAYLWLCLEHGMSIFVSGETASGKTTSLNAMLSFIDFKKKIYTAEDTPEVVVPQPVWQRLVTREAGPEESRVELFDLVKAALRSRPDYIVVGEVRGKEGAVAFQAIQTGHAVLSTFHASSIQKMIQRFTGAPINVPIRFMDNLNVALFQEIIYSEGRIIRRCSSIEEILRYSAQKGGVLTRAIFRWDPVTDTHHFRGMYNSHILENKIAPRMGMEDVRDIYKELFARARIIQKMVDKNVLDYDTVNAIFMEYSDKGFDGIPAEFR